jgi:hypothetical protein
MRASMPSNGLDPTLSDRIYGSIHNLTVALDAMFAEASPEALDRLRVATDELMRAAARIRLEVERLAQHRT